MKKQIALFRLLIILQILLFVALMVVAGAETEKFPQALKEYVDGQGKAMVENGQVWLFFVLPMLIMVAVKIGMFVFERFSRLLNVAMFLPMSAVVVGMGISIEGPWTHLLNILGYSIDGVLIGMSYFSAVAEKFEKGDLPSEG